MPIKGCIKSRIEETLGSNPNPVSGPSRASGVKFTWSQGFQERLKIQNKIDKIQVIPFEGTVIPFVEHGLESTPHVTSHHMQRTEGEQAGGTKCRLWSTNLELGT